MLVHPLQPKSSLGWRSRTNGNIIFSVERLVAATTVVLAEATTEQPRRHRRFESASRSFRFTLFPTSFATPWSSFVKVASKPLNPLPPACPFVPSLHHFSSPLACPARRQWMNCPTVHLADYSNWLLLIPIASLTPRLSRTSKPSVRLTIQMVAGRVDLSGSASSNKTPRKQSADNSGNGVEWLDHRAPIRVGNDFSAGQKEFNFVPTAVETLPTTTEVGKPVAGVSQPLQDNHWDSDSGRLVDCCSGCSKPKQSRGPTMTGRGSL